MNDANKANAAINDSPDLEDLRRRLKRLDFDGARKVADAAGAAFEKAGNARGQAWCRYYLADIYFEMGAFGLAEEASRECIKVFESLKDKSGQAWASVNLQRALCLMGDAPGSQASGDKALILFESLGELEGAASARRWLSVASQNMGRLDEAREDLKASLRSFLAMHAQHRLLECLHDLSWLEVATRHPAEALRLQRYLIRHPQSPRWAVVNVMPSVGRLESQPERLPDYSEDLEALVKSLI